ncbi:MAG: hypothetical protein Q7W02_00090 [Candidatus Rokubacteria bacterium]|nr:hypothetical protein [Candidatus Rokubacteria bacterium]
MGLDFLHVAEGGTGIREHDGDVDLWLHAPVDKGDMSPADRVAWPPESRQPALWAFLDAPGRATVCTAALECFAAEPNLDNHVLAGRIFDRLERRAEHATLAERARLLRIRVIMSQQLSTAADLAWRIRQKGDLLTSVLAQREQLDGLIARLWGAQ